MRFWPRRRASAAIASTATLPYRRPLLASCDAQPPDACAGGPGIAGLDELGGWDVPAAAGAQGCDHAGLRVQDAEEEVGGLDTGIIDVARVLDSGVDGV